MVPPNQVQPLTQRKAIVTGATGFLGSHFIYSHRNTDTSLYCLVRGKEGMTVLERVWDALRTAAESYRHVLDPYDFAQRLHSFSGDLQKSTCGVSPTELNRLRKEGIDEFWHFASSLNFEDHKKALIHAVNIEGLQAALELARHVGVKTFIYVSTAYTVGSRPGPVEETLHPTDRTFNNYYENSKCQAEHLAMNVCRAHAIECCIIRPSIVVGPRATLRPGGSDSGLYGFVREVFRIRDILERTESGIDLLGDPDTSLNLVPVDDVVADMHDLIDRGLPAGVYHSTSDFAPTIRDTLRVVSEVIRCKPVGVRAELDMQARSPIERVMDKRTVFYNGYLRNDKSFRRVLRNQPRGVTVAELVGYVTEFSRILRKSTYEKHFTVHRHAHSDGSELLVYRGRKRQGDAVVLVNAVGMPVEFWCSLAESLSDRYYLVTWESRGVPNVNNAFNDKRVAIQDQLSDLHEILEGEQIRSCHMIGWCTGAQYALMFNERYPELVKSLVLLNGTYNLPADTAPRTNFENQLRYLLPKMAENRKYAEFYHEIIYGNQNGNAVLESESGNDRERLSMVLNDIGPELVHMTSLPYRSVESVYRYAKLVVPYFNGDIREQAAGVDVPTLVVTGAQDQAAHHEASIALAKLIPSAHLYIEPDGDHFGFYNSSNVVARVRLHLDAHAPGKGEARAISLARLSEVVK